MDHLDIFKSIQEIIGVSDQQLQEVINELPDQKIFTYLSHKFHAKRNKIPQRNKTIFLESYRQIRDASWPDISTVEDFYNLPDHIQKECVEVHGFSPKVLLDADIQFEDFKPSSKSTITADQLMRFKHIVLDNREYIKDKAVADLACSAGFLATAMVHLAPRSFCFMDIRATTLELAKEAMSIMQVDPSKWQGLQADIHDYESNTDICKNKDTVFLCGVMYHVHDHFSLLESITKAAPATLIIETAENYSTVTTGNFEFKDVDNPLVPFKEESTDEVGNAYEKDKKTALVGAPNTAWFDLAMKSLGYSKVKPTKYFNICDIDATTQALDNDPEAQVIPIFRVRALHVYQRS